LAVVSDALIKLSAVKSLGDFGFGVDATYDHNTSRISAYNAALYYFVDKYRVVLKHVSTDAKAYTFGNLVGSFWYNHSINTKFAGTVTLTKSGNTSLLAGVQHQLSTNKTFKVRVNSDGVVGLNLRTKINPYLSITTANQLNAKSFLCSENSHWQLGFRIKINQ